MIVNFKKWMQYISNEQSLSSLTIPGTHDTMTYNLNYPNVWNKCQNISLKEQLDIGIRFIDIRLRYDDTKGLLRAYHGAFDAKEYFGDVMKDCIAFLNENPTETILMSIKNESGDWGDHFAEIIYKTATGDNQHWFYGDTIPKLGEVRGKIVLFRRYNKENPSFNVPDIGINLTDWPENMTFDRPDPEHATKIRYTIQDEYKVNDGDIKFDNYMKPVLEQAINDSDMTRLYINFASSTGANSVYQISWDVLTLFTQYLYDNYNTTKRYGIIPMDFPNINHGGHIIYSLILSNEFE